MFRNSVLKCATNLLWNVLKPCECGVQILLGAQSLGTMTRCRGFHPQDDRTIQGQVQSHVQAIVKSLLSPVPPPPPTVQWTMGGRACTTLGPCCSWVEWLPLYVERDLNWALIVKLIQSCNWYQNIQCASTNLNHNNVIVGHCNPQIAVR